MKKASSLALAAVLAAFALPAAAPGPQHERSRWETTQRRRTGKSRHRQRLDAWLVQKNLGR